MSREDKDTDADEDDSQLYASGTVVSLAWMLIFLARLDDNLNVVVR